MGWINVQLSPVSLAGVRHYRSTQEKVLLLGGLAGDADGEENGFVGVPALAVGVDAGGLHHGQAPGDGVEEETDVLNNKGGLGALGGGGEEGLDIFLGLGYGEAVLNDIAGGVFLLDGQLQAEKGPGVALGEARLPEQAEGLGGELQQAELVGHGGLGFADLAGHRLLGEAGGLQKGLEGLGLLHEVQIPPLDVLDEGQEGGLVFVHRHHNAGHLGETGHAGGPQAALPGNQLVAAVLGPADGQRLEYAELLNAGGQLLQALPGKAGAGLVRIGGNGGNGEKQHFGALKQSFSTQ